MGRAPCCDKTKVKTGPWSPTEDLRLTNFIQTHGHTNWRALPKQAGLLRCGKSCRLRWINYLRPDVKRGNFTPQEEEAIIQLHTSFGNKWSKIASCLPGRTDNEIKNVWNTHLKKRLLLIPNSASSTTISEKFVGDDDDKARLEEKPADYMKENELLDSPLSSSSSSSRVTKSHEESTFQQLGEMDFSWELDDDVDFWEIWESLDPNLLESNNNNNNIVEEEKIDNEVDQLDEWLKCLENELGLTNDDGRNT